MEWGSAGTNGESGHLSCRLFYCGITAAGCEELASALPSCQGLKNLQVGGNSLGDASMKPLCEALAHPSCHLEILGWVSHGFPRLEG